MNSTAVKSEGDVLYKAGKFQEACSKYSIIINQYANEPNSCNELYLCYSNRCACYLQLNNFDRALADAESCVRLKPAWPKGYNRKGSCLVRLNLKESAITAYKKALELDPSNSEARSAIQKIQSQGTSFTQQTTGGGVGGIFNNAVNTARSTWTDFSGRMSSGGWSGVWQKLQEYLIQIQMKFLTFWTGLDPTTRKYIRYGFFAYIVYYFFLSRTVFSGNSYGGGMSWTTWGMVMYGAYTVPPMFPDILGPQFARPFFGLSWSTFMMLLNMVSRNVGSGRGYRGYGGFNRRWY